ncbi:hypothetical protein AB0C28_10165 [Nonomuraea sp. NPDC048892]
MADQQRGVARRRGQQARHQEHRQPERERLTPAAYVAHPAERDE